MQSPPFTGERSGHWTRVVGREPLSGTGGEVDLVEAEEALGQERVSVVQVILEQDSSHSAGLSGRGHGTAVNVESQGEVGDLLLVTRTGHLQSLGSLRADEDGWFLWFF